ncbi:MAG: TIGR03862 family flavoprotein [Gammaproteobacteria bacterium]
MPRSIAVIGGGPAGLMAAEVLSQAGVQVDLYDAMPSVGRKFLMAGKGGMNISHSEPFDKFLSRYGTHRANIEPMLNHFMPDDLRAWAQGLGINTFIGSSGRVFPSDMKAAPLLRAWLHRLRGNGVNFHMRHRWLGWIGNKNSMLRFETPAGERQIKADAIVLALGGGSWPKLGSTGAWVSLLTQRGIPVEPLQPSNCGFDVGWSEYFRDRFAGQPLKTVGVSFSNSKGVKFLRQGELVITETGIEGGLIYALSAPLRDEITASGFALIYLDLAPDKNLEFLVERISQARGKHSMANHLRKRIGINSVKTGLLRELLSAQNFSNPVQLCTNIKALPLKLIATRPLDEAISSAGGVAFEALDEQLMIRALPGVFCAGEMLDWEAPTGGYLLTACFASGRTAGLGVLTWLQTKPAINSERTANLLN